MNEKSFIECAGVIGGGSSNLSNNDGITTDGWTDLIDPTDV